MLYERKDSSIKNVTNNTVKQFDSINLAKKHSRKLQLEGNSVRKVK